MHFAAFAAGVAAADGRGRCRDPACDCVPSGSPASAAVFSLVRAWSLGARSCTRMRSQRRATRRAANAPYQPKGPDRDRISAPTEPATPRQVARCHTDTTRSIPLGSTSPLRYSHGTSALFGWHLQAKARQGPTRDQLRAGVRPVAHVLRASSGRASAPRRRRSALRRTRARDRPRESRRRGRPHRRRERRCRSARHGGRARA